MIKIDCPGCIDTGGLWIWVNLTSPLCPSVSHFLLVPSGLSWCTVETMATTRHCPSKWLDVIFQNRKHMAKTKGHQKSDAWEKRKMCACNFTYPFSFVTAFSVYIICLFSCSYGKFWGGWTHSVSLSGRGRRYPSTTHSQFPPAASHLVQRWPQDSTKQSHVSIKKYIYICLFFFVLSFMFVFDPME